MAGGPEPMLAAARGRGLLEIAFCEHVFHVQEALDAIPWLRRFHPEGEPMSHAAYAAAVRGAARDAGVTVRLGLEIDVYPDLEGYEEAVAALAATYGGDWDVALGSVHVLSGEADVQGRTFAAEPEAVWADYLARVAVAASSGRYDVITHPVRLAYSLPDAPRLLLELLDRAAGEAAAADVALEVNGFDAALYPALVRELVAACVRHGTAISLGSDAHRPEQVGSVLAALPMLRELGVREVASFDRRERRMVPLPG